MKYLRISIIGLMLIWLSSSVLAQSDAEIITLDDATPAIDVVITLPPDTTGTLSLDLALASVTLTDANDAVVFTAADERLHGLEFNIAPNSGTHTLTVERLPGVAEAYVSVVSLPEMTLNGETELIQGEILGFNQETELTMNPDKPGGTITVDLPTESTGVVTATFPGANATTQLVDSEGSILAESTSGHVDGLTFVLDGGNYDLTVLSSGLVETVIAGVRTVSVDDSAFSVMAVPTPDETETAGETDEMRCTASINASSVNLRSGPGTGYSILDYGYRGESYPVGGINTERNWVVIGTDSNDGSAWVSRSIIQINGDCGNLAVFDMPLRESQPAPVIVVTPEPQVIIEEVPVSVPSSSGSGSSYDDYDDDDDDDEYDHDDDDHDDDDHDDDDHDDDD